MGVFLLDPYVRHLSEVIGVSYPQLNFVFAMISAYPFALAYRYIKDTKARILASIVFGMFLQYQMIGWSMNIINNKI